MTPEHISRRPRTAFGKMLSVGVRQEDETADRIERAFTYDRQRVPYHWRWFRNYGNRVPVALHRKHQCSLFRRQRPDANAHLYGILYSCWSWDVVSSQDLCCSDCAAVPRDGPMARRGKHLPCSIPMDADQHCFRRHTLSPLVFHNNWMETTEIGCRTRKWTRTQVSRAASLCGSLAPVTFDVRFEEMKKKYLLALVISICLVGCASTKPQPPVTVPAVVQSQFKSAPMYGSTAICKATVPMDEFTKRKAAGEVVESIPHDGFVYFLTEEVWGETLPNGSHVDGVMIDGVFRTKLK
jgi:hypothetical protein